MNREIIFLLIVVVVANAIAIAVWCGILTFHWR